MDMAVSHFCTFNGKNADCRRKDTVLACLTLSSVDHEDSEDKWELITERKKNNILSYIVLSIRT